MSITEIADAIMLVVSGVGVGGAWYVVHAVSKLSRERDEKARKAALRRERDKLLSGFDWKNGYDN